MQIYIEWVNYGGSFLLFLIYDTLTYTSNTEHIKATPCSVSIHAINTYDV